MKALRSFTVRPRMPEALGALEDLAMNLRWAWDGRTRDLFRWVDPDAWEEGRHDPVRLLATVGRDRLAQLEADPAFTRFLGEVHEDLQRYVERPRWFQDAGPSPLRSVAYFSPEFGIAEALPQYSGGLGVLAGDHLKAASDLGIPLVGVGLFYRHGYFRQSLNADGWQQERYPSLDPFAMAVRELPDVRVQVSLAGTPLSARVWRADVGRIRLYLLDADVEENDPDLRIVTDRLYGGDKVHRLRQEILLGIGGVRALEAVGEDPQVFHTNEGHAGFLSFERIRRLVVDAGLSFGEALEASRAATVFTTHTPVPAGIDRFPRPEMERYFGDWADECGITPDEMMALGHEPGEDPDAPFNMAVMGLRLAGRSNAVSKLHGETSRSMFATLWPGVPVDEVPITSVTNGVHAGTWVSPEMDDLLGRFVLPEWHDADPERWARINEAGDDEVWRVCDQGRERLVAFVRAHLRSSLGQRGLGADASWADQVLDPKALTVCFARRFATYKRATLLLSQPERLKALLLSAERPVQLVFAGKAHPADELGKEMIRQIVAFSSDPEVRHRIVFVDDYDIAVARQLYQGADVWLNNPRRPQEACGTSGEKAALNGALNCSILDGWWDEMFDGENGWAISSAEGIADLAKRDQVEADSLFALLEDQIVPMFYERTQGPVPRRWVQRVKTNLSSLGHQVSAARMVRDYVQQLYEPTAARADALASDGFARATALAGWKERVASTWKGVHVDAVDTDEASTDLGYERSVSALVSLSDLGPDDVEVQLLHGPVGQSEELTGAAVVPMVASGKAPDGHRRYTGTFTCEQSGRYGFTVRIVPSHPDLVTPVELGRVAWG
ncbi:MAG TPA: alpha-glucan family phosphorylase [Acidimicrobiales bacterium]|nr:alpha-glucan family phosphorylase [Acidimicrobiales bacterium]